MEFWWEKIIKNKLLNINNEDLVNGLNTSNEGLTQVEAENRIAKFGLNTFKDTTRLNIISLIIKQFKSSLIYLLIVATILAFILGDINDGIIIFIFLIINTGLGFFQEYKSENAVAKLQKLVSKEILVRRDGTETLVYEQNIVPGDLVILREGDIVPADIKLIHVNNLTVDESQLTGESIPQAKKTHGEASIAYAGSTVQQGEGSGFVYATANSTELGKIAGLSDETKKVTKYEQQLSSFSSFLIKVTFLTLAIVFILKLVIDHGNENVVSLGLFIVALSITVVPEAMPIIATITLSRGAMKLANQHVIAKNLTSVEDLGNVNILCSDKTGTLTQNILTVKEVYAENLELFQLFAIGSLESVDEKRKKFQNPFDRALLEYVPKEVQSEANKYKRLSELPFDPSSRRRRVIFTDNKRTYLVEIGSVETLLEVCHEHKDKKKILDTVNKNGKLGLRHYGIAYKTIEYSDGYNILKHEDKLKFVGFAALEDPLRTSTKHTLQTARDLGLVIKILSGDSREVTHYVASEVGLIDKSATVYVGSEIDKMDNAQLSHLVLNNDVFARLNPEQKYRIIELLKKTGNTIGYQGDGINDAPALKLADVAIAVNNASDVAQESADILLLRNDIGVIVNGVKYGRAIFSNINKYIRYTMIGNFGNFFALSALFLVSGSTLPLLPIQLILTGLLTDIPLVTIATDNVEIGDLKRPSKYNTHALMFISLFLGSFTALFEIMYFSIIRMQPAGTAQTALFLFLTLSGLVVILSVRNRDHFWKAPKLSPNLLIALIFIAITSILVIYLEVTRRLFSFASISLSLLSLTLILTITYLFILDLVKVWFYRSRENVEI